jgi:DNA-binding transcriptional LysR family regulator
MRDLDFDDMDLFARVADLGTLSAVARERNVPVSQVSRSLSRIEASSGVRLIQRSTHGLSLTPEGDIFLGYSRRLTGTLDELQGEFATKAREATGLVRVAASPVMAHYQLTPSLAGLAQRHPRLRVELQVDDRILDMARAGIDIAIRTGDPQTDTVVARRIGSMGRRLYAAPAYLAAHGTPDHPDALGSHRLVANSAVAALNQWPFIVKGRRVVLSVEGHWRSDNSSVMTELAVQGLGIARLATVVGEPLAARGLLVPLLREFADTSEIPIHAVTLAGRHRLPKIRACIDHWAAWFAKMPVA